MFYKVKTDYGSPKQSLITLSSIATIALKNKVKHIVITDNTLYAVPKAQELFADNLHLIIGLQLYLCEDPEDPNRMPLEFSLYAKNYDGYLTLCKIQTESQKHVITRDGNRTYPTVTIQIIKEMLGSPLGKGNVFMSTGGNDGIILGVIDKDAINNDIDNEKKANLGKIYEKIQTLRDLKHEHSELEAEKEISAALAKRKFDSEKQKYALMENPPVSDVEDMLRRIEETEIAKETLKTVVSKINSLHSKIKGEEISIARMCGFDTFQDKLVDQYLKDSVQNLFGEEVENIDDWFKGNAESGIENIDTLNVSKIRNELNKFKTIAGDDLLVDIESHSTDTEMIYMPIICRISEELGIRIIASHMATMEYEEDYLAKKAINSLGMDEWASETEGEREEYIKSEEELNNSLYQCIGCSYTETAIDNMSILENECNVMMVEKEYYPIYPCTEYSMLSDDEVRGRLEQIPLSVEKSGTDYDGPITRQDILLIEKSWKGALKLFNDYDENSIPTEYKDRLEEELNTILSMGFSSYFLIVADFFNTIGEKIGHMPDERLEYLRENYQDMSLKALEEYIQADQSWPGITVGFGRGSAVGSLVAYCLGITSIDPIKHGLLFSRFLNVSRRTMPDIDSDFSKADEKYGVRDIVLEYCSKKYGQACVCGITTPQTLAAHGAILAMARAYGYYMKTDFLSLSKSICSCVSNKSGAKLCDYEPEIKKYFGKSKDAMTIFALAKRVEGINWNLSKHPCGVIITGDGDVDRYAPLLRDNDTGSWKIAMYAESAEMRQYLKMDFLGLRTLNQLTDVVRLIYKNRGINLDLRALPQETEVYDSIFATGLTDAIFQLESPGMKNLLRRFGNRTDANTPSMTFDDIILLLACFRPGPMQYLDGIINRRQGNIIPKDVLKKIAGYSNDFASIVNSTRGDFRHIRQIIDTFKILGDYSEEEAKRMYLAAKRHDMAAKSDFTRRANIRYEDAKDLFDVIGCENAITILSKTCDELRRIIEPTYHAMVYQEQVMMTAIELAGYSMGEADELRRAMGHKKMSALAEEGSKFVQGCIQHGIHKEDAESLFEEMLDFGKYALNKSHAAAYAALSYCAAYLKYHFPTEFYTGTLNHTHPKKYSAIINEASHFGIKIKVPDINESKALFTGSGESIYFGFTGIKGIGLNSALSFECDGRPYKSVADFVYRTDISEANLNSLIEAGAFDSMLNNRCALKAIAYDLCEENHELKRTAKKLDNENMKLMDIADETIDYCQKYSVEEKPSEKSIKEQIESLEAELSEHKSMLLSEIIAPIDISEDMSLRLEQEREKLGIPVSMSLLDLYALDDNKSIEIDNLVPQNNVSIIGEIRSIREITTKKGQKMCFLILEDKSGAIDVTVFPRAFQKHGTLLKTGAVLKFFGNVEEKSSGFDSNVDNAEIKLQFLANSIGILEKKRSTYLLYIKRGLSEWLKIYPKIIQYKTDSKGHDLLIKSGVSGRTIRCGFKVNDSIMKEKALKIKKR